MSDTTMTEGNDVTTQSETQEDPRAAKLRALRAEVAAAKGQASAAVEARHAAAEEADLLRELEDAKRAEREAKILTELEAEHGREGVGFLHVSTTLGMVCVKKPNHLRYKRFLNEKRDDTRSVQSLAEDCLIYPDKVRFAEICEDQADTIRKCGNAIAYLHGTRIKEELPGK